MDDLQLLLVFRGAERLLIEVGALTTIILGTLLYRWGVRSPQQLEASGSGFSFALRNAAPGSVLALFGMTVLVVGLTRPIDARYAREAITQPLPTETGVSSARDAVKEEQRQALSFTYHELPDAVRQELDLIGSLRDVEPKLAAQLLRERRQFAAALLAQARLPSEVLAFFQRVSEAPDTQDAAATLTQLSDAARRAKAKLAAATPH